jgi:hypothetical protein
LAINFKNVKTWYSISVISAASPLVIIVVSGLITKLAYKVCRVANDIPDCPIGNFFAGLSWGFMHMTAFLIAIGFIILFATTFFHTVILVKIKRYNLGMLTGGISFIVAVLIAYLIYEQSQFHL